MFAVGECCCWVARAPRLTFRYELLVKLLLDDTICILSYDITKETDRQVELVYTQIPAISIDMYIYMYSTRRWTDDR